MTKKTSQSKSSPRIPTIKAKQVVVGSAWSGKAQIALVAMRLNGTSVQMQPSEARRVARELCDASYRAEEDTVHGAEYDPALTDVRVAEAFPGAWIDGNGCLHFSLEEFHKLHGMPDDEASRAETMAIFRDLWKDLYPGEKLIFREKPGDEGKVI